MVEIFVGKRRKSVARACIEKGKGRVLINSIPLEQYYTNKYLKMFVEEPLILAGDLSKKVNIYINVKGGGIIGQAEAVRQAIAKSLVGFFKDEKLKHVFLEYDRNLLIYDPRRNEPHKPSRSKKGPRRHKQRSKR